jgi:hypothetical protein
VGEYRVFYDVDEPGQVVYVRAVRRKEQGQTTGYSSELSTTQETTVHSAPGDRWTLDGARSLMQASKLRAVQSQGAGCR